jgi:hypothetical protein
MPTPRFTRIQQDRQARNKEPNADTFDDDSSDDGGRFGEYDLYVLLAITSMMPFLPYHIFDIAFFVYGDSFNTDWACRYGNESYTTLVTRREAVYVLDNPELLMMHAQARNDVCGHYFFVLLLVLCIALNLDATHLKEFSILLPVLL